MIRPFIIRDFVYFEQNDQALIIMTSSSDDFIRFLENCAKFRYDTSTNNEDRTVCVCVCVCGGGGGGGASTKHIHVKRPSPIRFKSIVM